MNATSNQARVIFLEAIEHHTPDSRADFLDRACEGDANLLGRVEQLLQSHELLGTFHDEPAQGTATIHQPVTEIPGDTIGPYKLLQQIGEGGMGVVFMAEQTEPIQRTVALKIIKPGMDTRQVIARFEAERQVLAMMDHPNIARVLDAGTTETGRPYFVMDLVKGVPITTYCDQQQLSIRRRLELMTTVCQAVQHAHQKGIIHRDLKPSNVLVAEYDGRPVPKVIDFGVAKATAQWLTDKTMFTEYGQLIGTFEYMSPEQARFNQLDVDTRSDIYSLGVLLYEVLAGSTPLEKERLRTSAFDEVLRIICEEEPPRPSLRLSASQLLPSISAQRQIEPAKLKTLVRGELDWIVMKCLEKDRNRRYDSAGSLARDVERYLADEAVQACPPSTTYRLKKFVRRNKIAASFVLLLVAAVAALTVSNAQTRRSERRATTENAKATAVSDLLQEMLGSADATRSKGINYTVRELLDDFSAGLGSQLTGQPEVEADIHATIGRAYRSLMLPGQALPHFEKAIELRRQIDGPQSGKLAAVLVDEGWNLRDEQKYVEAESQLREALEIYRQGGVTGRPVFHALEILQHVLISSGRDVDAEHVTQEALAIVGQSGEEFPDKANLLHRYADLKISQGHFAEAEQLARQAVDMHRRLHGDQHPETAWALKALASALRAQDKLAEAESALRESVAIFRGCYPTDNLELRVAVNDLQRILEQRGDQPTLVALAKEVREQATGSRSLEFHVHLAELLLANNQSGRAREKAARRLIRWAIDGYGRVAVDSPGNLDFRLQAVQGYAEVARICALAPAFANEFDEVDRRLDVEMPELLSKFPDRGPTVDTLYIFALARLRLGDVAGYRAACGALADVQDGGIDETEFRRIWAWCLGPDALEDLSLARKHVEEIVATEPQNTDYLLPLGGLLYRDGQYERAAERLQESITAIADNKSTKATVAYPQLLLAMTKWQMGQHAEARRLLAETQPAVDEELQSTLIFWNRWATYELLRGEAEALIQQVQLVAAPSNIDSKPILPPKP